MAKTIGPLLAFGADGQIGKAIVYAKWKGLKYARQYVIPANPKTTAQVETRNTFRWVHDAYKYLDSAVQESWILYSKGQKFTPANAWMSANLPILRGAANNDSIIFSKPVLGGPPTVSITATGGATDIAITGVPPTLITGWSIVEMVGIAMRQEAPSGEHEAKISSSATKNATPWTVTLTGLVAGDVYVCGCWFKFLRPDGKNAYGASVNTTATPT